MEGETRQEPSQAFRPGTAVKAGPRNAAAVREPVAQRRAVWGRKRFAYF